MTIAATSSTTEVMVNTDTGEILTPMSETDARRITTRIKGVFATATEAIEKISMLVVEAEAGQAWKPLGYQSWTAYLVGEFKDEWGGLDRALRGQAIIALSEAGLSTRAIADLVSTSQSTVTRTVREQLSQSDSPVPDAAVKPEGKVISLDGKSHPRTRKSTPAAPGRKSRRRPLSDAYEDAVCDLQAAAERILWLHLDDRFRDNRDAIKHHWSALSDVWLLVSELESELDKDLTCRECGGPRMASAKEELCVECQHERGT